ncbi:MAG: CopG family transcriptional regulator [Firmicutes bacterium]|nr:CopG family transcriptional regulator [Bacillota bacterium]
MMERQNITLSLPKEILNRLKHIAVDKNTSISGLLAQTLTEIVRKEDAYRTAKTRQLILMERGFDLGRGPSRWNREELHERR